MSRKIKGIIFFLTAVVLCGLFFNAKTQNVTALEEKAYTIEPGVVVEDLDLSGMTVAEATEALQSIRSRLESKNFTLKGESTSATVTAADLGVTVDIDLIAKKAEAVAHSGNLIQRYKDVCDLKDGGVSIDTEYVIDEEKTTQLLTEKSSELNVPAVDNGLKKDGDTFVFIEGTSGQQVNIESSVQNICDFFVKMGRSFR